MKTTAAKVPAPAPAPLSNVVTLVKTKDCRTCVKFEPDPDMGIIGALYVSRRVAGISAASVIQVTIETLP